MPHRPPAGAPPPAVVPTASSGFPDDVSVAVVAHDSAASLAAAVDAISASGCPASRTLVVDIASTDDGIARMRDRHPDVPVRRLERNDGPNPGRNEALRLATTPFLLLMDADVALEPGAVDALRRALEDPAVKVAAPLVLHASRPDLIQYAGGGLHFICEAVNPWMDRAVADRGHQADDIGAAPGCALMIARDAALEVGLFDERYFMGKEDGDFLHRLRIAGHRIREVPDAQVLHHSRPRTAWLFEYQVRNRWHFLLRNYQVQTLVVLLPALAVHEVLQLAVLIAKGQTRAWLRAVAGLGRMLPRLRSDRAAVGRYRRLGDRELLRDDPLILRADLPGIRPAGGLKAAYDAWLRTYWRLIRPLVRSR